MSSKVPFPTLLGRGLIRATVAWALTIVPYMLLIDAPIHMFSFFLGVAFCAVDSVLRDAAGWK